MFDKGYYTLSQVIVMLNQMQYIILNIQCNYKFWMYPDEFQQFNRFLSSILYHRYSGSKRNGV